MMAASRRIAALTVAVSLTMTGCSSSGLASLPLPHPGPGKDGFSVTVVFENALNVPAFATVRLAGADVGQMESIEARDYTAVATLRIADGIRLPRGTTAELRSATPLGDVFIAVKPPANASSAVPLLTDGDTIGISDTRAAATVENLLTGAAVLVNGGAVQNLTDIVNGAGKAAGEDGGRNLAQLIDHTNRLLGTMNARTGQLSDSLTALSGLSRQIDAKSDVISELMSAAAPATDTLAQHTNQIADLVVQAGSTTEMLSRFPSLAGTDTSGRSVIADLNTMSSAFNDVAVDPDTSLVALNRLMPPFVKAFAGNSFAAKGSIDRLVLGSMPDIGFPGDPGFHGPKWSNWNQFVGSFQYTLLRLQERIVGQGPNIPQVPVIPSPTDPGQWAVSGPPPGPTGPTGPPGPPPGPTGPGS
ncbi:MAG: MlaD family protein [Mycobacterium sp.]|nr:MlaD family protein [Mycobacterium sp.]